MISPRSSEGSISPRDALRSITSTDDDVGKPFVADALFDGALVVLLVAMESLEESSPAP